MPTRIKLITTDCSLLKWRSLTSKYKAIMKELATIEGADFVLAIEYRDLVPEVINGRITHAWMDGLRSTLPEKNYAFVAFHMTDFQRKLWGIVPRGSYQDDYDLVQEFYFWADEFTKREKRNQFVQTFLHEFRHAFMKGANYEDDTHEAHADGDIRGSFKGFRMADFNPGQSIITRLLNRITSMKKELPLFHPVQLTPRDITQRYGVKNARYSRTGRHLGTDYPLPLGTPLYAPWDGVVTTVGSHPALGYFLHFTYTKDGATWEERWCHLRQLPKPGVFTRGQVIARSGNTGDSTGPHLHREAWRNDVRIDLINKTNWSVLTADPELIK